MAKSPKCDPQREKVYRWENGFGAVRTGDMGTRKFYSLLRTVSEDYGVVKPRAAGMHKCWKAWAAACLTEEKLLCFDKGFCTAHILLHELAHYILDQYGFGSLPEHGPKWLGLYLYLLGRYKALPLSASIPSARAYGLKFEDPRTFVPSTIMRIVRQGSV